MTTVTTKQLFYEIKWYVRIYLYLKAFSGFLNICALKEIQNLGLYF